MFGEVSGLLPVDVVQTFKEWRVLKKNIHAILRLLYLECLKNVELLKCLNLEDSKVPQNDPDFFRVIEQLEITTIEFLFLEGEKNTKIFNILSEKSEIIYEKGDRKTQDSSGQTEITLIQVVIFIYLKINVLKKLSRVYRTDGGFLEAGKGKVLKNIRYKTRLNNIKSNLIEIIKVLERQKEFKKIMMRRYAGIYGPGEFPGGPEKPASRS